MSVQIVLGLDNEMKGLEFAKKFMTIFNASFTDFQYSPEIKTMVIDYASGYSFSGFLLQNFKPKIVWQQKDELRVTIIDLEKPLDTSKEELVYNELSYIVLEAILIFKRVGLNETRLTILFEKCVKFFSSQNFFQQKPQDNFFSSEEVKTRLEKQNQNIELTYYIEREGTLRLEVSISLWPYVDHGEKYDDKKSLNQIIIPLYEKINRELNNNNAIHRKHETFWIHIALVDPDDKFQNFQFQITKKSEIRNHSGKHTQGGR